MCCKRSRYFVTASQTAARVHSLALLVSSLVKCPSEKRRACKVDFYGQLSRSVKSPAVINLSFINQKCIRHILFLQKRILRCIPGVSDFIHTCTRAMKPLCGMQSAEIRPQEMLGLNFLSRPDAHQDHRYV